jgi:hypothetical protein
VQAGVALWQAEGGKNNIQVLALDKIASVASKTRLPRKLRMSFYY